MIKVTTSTTTIVLTYRGPANQDPCLNFSGRSLKVNRAAYQSFVNSTASSGEY